ncbi:MAG TPA: type II toxin-antitoxin system prevent-host-death family antitoxin [Terriglobales bacterium]|nr:type II toxin-antitoxin system prevent-host-death family antitoxin [Terriglobales bacterium]
MKKMSAAKFKAQCLSVMDNVQETGEPIIVTKRGKPVVQVTRVKSSRKPFIGRLVGIVEVTGDLLEPAVRPEDWELD